MSESPAVVDYKSWDSLAAQCESIENLTTFEREQAKRAFAYLRGELGDSFLTQALEFGHPLTGFMLNLAPWTRKWLPAFAEQLRFAKSDPSYENIRSRLLDPKRFTEAYQVLRVATAFRRQGFSVATDPNLSELSCAKVPDLLLRDEATGDRIFLEVSALGESESSRDAHSTMNRLHAPLWRGVPFLWFAARIHRTLSPRHLEEIGGRVDGLVKRVQTERAFASLVVDGVLEIGIAPEADKSLLEQWTAARGLTVGTMQGPPIRTDELQRVRAKIRKEQEQLPAGFPGIVVVFSNNLFPFVKDHRALIGELEEAVYHHDHLLGVVVGGGYMGTGMPDELMMQGQHIYLRKTLFDLLIEEYAVLLNQFCSHKVSASSVTKFYNAFKPEASLL